MTRHMKAIAVACFICFIGTGYALTPVLAQEREANRRDAASEGAQAGYESSGRELERPTDPRALEGRAPRLSNPMFEAIDTDGDGVISPRELRRAAAALKALDRDGDGYITLEEAMQPLNEEDPAGQAADGEDYGVQMNQMIDQIMAENDRNGDGVLSPEEVSPQLAQMLQGADLNGDGVVDRDELAAALQNMWNQGGQVPFGAPGQMRGGGVRGAGAGNTQQLMRRIMQFDRNGDGVLTPDEIPPEFRGLLGNADLNGDGKIDAREIRAALENARQRMGNQREDQRGYNPANRPAVNPENFQRGIGGRRP